MTEVDTAWWAHLWENIEQYAFLAVVVALAIEFGALKFGATSPGTARKSVKFGIIALAREFAEACENQSS